MTRLAEAATAVVELRTALYRSSVAQYVPLTDRIVEALNRMTQLEKVAELARALADPNGRGPRADRVALLDMALSVLDHQYPETWEK